MKKFFVIAALFSSVTLSAFANPASDCCASQASKTDSIQQVAPNTPVTLYEGTKSWEGSTLPTMPLSQPHVKISRYKFEPGYSTPWHQHDEVLAAYMLSGELTVATQDGKDKHTFRPGDAFVECFKRFHQGTVTSSVPAEFIVFTLGESK